MDRKRSNREDKHRRRSEEREKRIKMEEDDEDFREKSHREGRSRKRKYGLDRKDRNREEEARWGKAESFEKKEDEVVMEKQKVNLATSGKLAEDTNTFRGVVIKYNEPPEAKKPVVRWQLFPFKGDEALPPMYIHRQSAYLVGRDRKVADIPIDHPSCSKQHAALQYRSISYNRDDGTTGRRTLPYIIDLGSANGTFLNGKQIDSERYYELQEKDIIKFGFSSREYVILNEKSTEEDRENSEGE